MSHGGWSRDDLLVPLAVWPPVAEVAAGCYIRIAIRSLFEMFLGDL